MVNLSIPKSTITIIGTGLIGSSLARAIREAALADHIIGFDNQSDNLQRALEIGVIDACADNLEAAIKASSWIILAVPPGAIATLCPALTQHANADTIIMDVGSVKGSVVAAASRLPEHLYFVPSHPVAGTEQSGPDAGFAALFKDRWSILTPLAREDAAYQNAVERVKTFWTAIGAYCEVMDPHQHDLALAVTSHLPHLIAFTLVGAADDLETVTEAEIVKYSAGGFRDFTRIAASDPIMWRDVFLNNKEAILEVLGRFSEELALLQRAIRWGDGERLREVFSRGRALRRAIVAAGQETAAPNFGRDRDNETTGNENQDE